MSFGGHQGSWFFSSATWKSLPLPALSVSLALLSTQKEAFYSLLPGESWVSFLSVEGTAYSSYFHTFIKERNSTNTSALLVTHYCEQRIVLELVCCRYSITKVKNRLCPFFLHPPARKWAKLPSLFSLLGRKHARSAYESASKERPGDSAVSSAICPTSYLLSR